MRILTLTALFGLAIQLLSSCNTDQKQANTKNNTTLQHQTIGINTAVRLDKDSTVLYLADFFKDYNEVTEYSFPNGLTVKPLENGVILLLGNIEMPMAQALFTINNQVYSVPLIQYNKTTLSFAYQGKANSVSAVGDFNAWDPAGGKFQNLGGNQWAFSIEVNPGIYNYQFQVDGKRITDPNNPKKVDNGSGGFNSQVVIEDKNASKKPNLHSVSLTKKEIILRSSNPATKVLASFANLPIETISIAENEIKIEVPSFVKSFPLEYLSIFAVNEFGFSNQVIIPFVSGEPTASPKNLPREDKFAQSLYFLMVDRFNDGDPTNNKPVNDPEIHPRANYLGGDLQGVIDKINDGYFESLGIKTIWLSPITQNPEEAYGLWPNPRTKFSGYHGYWPVTLTTVDYRFGSAVILKNLISAAHAKNMNVILDYVANHVHELHPLVKENPHWTTPLYLPDGTMNTEKWDEHRLTTWFDTFMPTLNLELPEVYEPMTDSALFWIKDMGLDGFRHDATKHIATVFWRTLTRKIKEQVMFPQQKPVYQIGETYGSRELIASYLGSGLLDAQFDFNLYDDAINTLARPELTTNFLKNSLKESLQWYGSIHSMGNITGNQDRARFISYAAGDLSFAEDAKEAGWTRYIGIQDSIAFKYLALLHAFNYAIPGVPVIYYGDEIGLSGGNDPDNRKMMRFKNLAKKEAGLLNQVQKIAALRNNSMSLIYGETEVLTPTENTMVIIRNYFGEVTVLAFNKGKEEEEIALDLSEYNVKNKLNLQLGNASISAFDTTISITLPPLEYVFANNK